MYSVRSYISPPFFNFSPFFIVCLSLPLCCIHKQLGWIKHFNDPRLISAFALNSPSSRGKAKVWFEICTSDCGRIITPEIFFQKFKLCTSSPPCTLEYVSFKAAWFIIFQNSENIYNPLDKCYVLRSTIFFILFQIQKAREMTKLTSDQHFALTRWRLLQYKVCRAFKDLTKLRLSEIFQVIHQWFMI